MHTLCLYVLFTYFFCSGKYRFDYLKCLFPVKHLLSNTLKYQRFEFFPSLPVWICNGLAKMLMFPFHVKNSKGFCFFRHLDFSFVNVSSSVKLCICAVEGCAEHVDMHHKKCPYNGLAVCLSSKTKAYIH